MYLYTPAFFTEAFSISEVMLLDSEGFPLRDGKVYGVQAVTVEPEVTTEMEMSNDRLIGAWSSVRSVALTLETGFMSWKVWEAITGTQAEINGNLATSGSSVAMPLWSPVADNGPKQTVRFTVTAKDSSGNLRYLDYVLYAVKFKPVKFAAHSYKEGAAVTMEATVLLSDNDETGAALDQPAYGQVRSIAGIPVSTQIPTVAPTAAVSLGVSTSPFQWHNTLHSQVRVMVTGAESTLRTSQDENNPPVQWFYQGVTPATFTVFPGEWFELSFPDTAPAVSYVADSLSEPQYEWYPGWRQPEPNDEDRLRDVMGLDHR